MDKPVLELWEREDGWTIEVYSREPRDVGYVPLIVPADDGSYRYFVMAAKANGYKLIEPATA